MDPVPIDNRNHSCDEILATASKLATIFKNAAGLYSDLAPTFTTFSVSCTTFAEAVRAIQSWLTDGPEKQLLDSAPWYQLTTSLGRAEKVITVLQDEVQSILRSRYESRSRSRVNTEWNLESLQNYEEDVQHETGTLQQILQYMQLLSITDMTSKAQAENHQAAEELGLPHASSPLTASGSQADTENTLDRPAPPYHLFDVRSKETHTRWHPEQSVVAIDDAKPSLPSAMDDAADGSTVRAMKPSTCPAPADITESDDRLVACPGCGCHMEIERMVEHINTDHSDEADYLLNFLIVGALKKQPVVFPKPLKSVIYRFQVDNLDISFDDWWPWKVAGLNFSERIHVDKDLPASAKEIIENLKTSTNLLYALLKKIRPHFNWAGDSDIEQLFFKIDTLWKLCMSTGVMVCNSDLGTHHRAYRLHFADDSVSFQYFMHLVQEIDKFATDSKLSDSTREVYFGMTLRFASKIQKKYGAALVGFMQLWAGLNLSLQICSFDF